jgi:hypothetical protein
MAQQDLWLIVVFPNTFQSREGWMTQHRTIFFQKLSQAIADVKFTTYHPAEQGFGYSSSLHFETCNA